MPGREGISFNFVHNIYLFMFREHRIYVNMEEKELVELALENLENTTGIHGNWRPGATQFMDGYLKLRLDNKYYTFNAEVKNKFRNHHLHTILDLTKQFEPYMVIANYIQNGMKETLRKNHIAYLETNGNLFTDIEDKFVWIETKNPRLVTKNKPNRAFTPTGLKVIFHFLLDEDLINKTYRDIAETTDVALGNINYVIHGLRKEGFLIKLTKDKYKLTRKKELLMKWVEAYHQYLKPKLKIGTFKFVNKETAIDWKKIKLKNGETYWGGEPAGDLLTKYLQPGEFTIYTTEGRQDLIKEYKILPADHGNVFIYKKFWNINITGKTVPEILAYADLVDTPDRRKQETAQKIYEQYLQTKFKGPPVTSGNDTNV